MIRKNYDSNVFTPGTPENINLVDFQEAMERDTFACIRGIIDPDDVAQALVKLRDRFDRNSDHPGRGQSPDAVRSNFQKLNIGGESKTAANDDARLFRAFYNPIWDEDIYDFRDSFIQLAKVRNVLAELPLDFAIEGIEDNGLWTASRFHQYPTGGGFFRRHTDYVVNDVAKEKGTKFYQILLLMTSKGEHFKTGGGFVDLGEDRICLEDYFLPGDILVYDGRSVHGVDDIDTDLPLDLDTFSGRVAAFVTLFKKLD